MQIRNMIQTEKAVFLYLGMHVCVWDMYVTHVIYMTAIKKRGHEFEKEEI